MYVLTQGSAHSSCANERRSVVGGVRGVESLPQKEKSNIKVMEKIIAEKIIHDFI